MRPECDYHGLQEIYPVKSYPAMSVEDVHFAYGKKAVLRGVSFSVPSGSVCGIFGPNGSGKTTLFRCCLGLLKPDKGNITIHGENVASMGISRLARHIAYVPQEQRPGFPFLVREIVSMGRTPHMSGLFRLGKNDIRAVDLAMEAVGITDLADESCTALSGGQRQLTSLARALAQEASLMLLDEPTSALDFNNQVMVWQSLERIAQSGVTVLICCHDPNHILWFCDYAAVLRHGTAVAGPSRQTLNADLLKELYGPAIEICSLAGHPLVRPVTLGD